MEPRKYGRKTHVEERTSPQLHVKMFLMAAVAGFCFFIGWAMSYTGWGMPKFPPVVCNVLFPGIALGFFLLTIFISRHRRNPRAMIWLACLYSLILWPVASAGSEPAIPIILTLFSICMSAWLAAIFWLARKKCTGKAILVACIVPVLFFISVFFTTFMGNVLCLNMRNGLLTWDEVMRSILPKQDCQINADYFTGRLLSHSEWKECVRQLDTYYNGRWYERLLYSRIHFIRSVPYKNCMGAGYVKVKDSPFETIGQAVPECGETYDQYVKRWGRLNVMTKSPSPMPHPLPGSKNRFSSDFIEDRQ